MKTHYLKCHPEPFQAILDRRKKHEWRKNDREFGVGHTLFLQEWDPESNDYTGREKRVTVTYISRGPQFGIPEGWCCMSILVRINE